MSFEVVCSGCGAVSSPSVGVCPYCKRIMSLNHLFDQGGSGNTVESCYRSGDIARALYLAQKVYTEQADKKNDVQFLILYVRILIETEGPSFKIKDLLAQAQLLGSGNQEVLDYIEIMEARDFLRKGINDPGEIRLRNVIRRTPQNPYAHFYLGAHLFWEDSQKEMAIPYLENCVRTLPNFLRAWGCLASIYKKMGNLQLAQHAFRKCFELETNPRLKDFFEQELKNCQ